MATISGCVLAACVLATLAPSLAVANDDEKSFNRYTRLVDTWDVQVTTRNCQTNAALRTFASILTYYTVVALLESIAGIPQSVKTPGKACGAPSATTPITLNLSRCDLMPAAISRVRSRLARSSI